MSHNAFRSALVRKFTLCALLLNLFLATGWSQGFTLQLPLSRFSHGFSLHVWDSSLNEYELAPESASLTPEGSLDPNVPFSLAAESYLTLTFSFNPP